MNKKAFIDEIENMFPGKVTQGELLSRHTTIGIGGPAEIFYIAKDEVELKKVLGLAGKHAVPVWVLGGGSNVIVSDKGLEGLVIKIQLNGFEKVSASEFSIANKAKVKSRLSQLSPSSGYNIENLNGKTTQSGKPIYIKVGAGWRLSALMQRCLSEEITGLEWFSGIPSSVGGAVYMNIHGGESFFSDFIVSVTTLALEGESKTYTRPEMKFDYDCSIFQQNKEIVTSVVLRLYKGNVKSASEVIKKWGVAKITNQPQKSAGCIFQNLNKTQQQLLKLPTPSIGYIIDTKLHLSGYCVGGARISPKHAGFIENINSASASDVKTLVELVEKRFKDKYGLDLKREVEFIGSFV
ncbi:MAG: FAD-binding protein [Patescibacteria group bacterium]|jgi:UDP-N-acetylmuramate dehydrogenase